MLCRKRKANFTKQELEVLVANVQARKDVLFTKRNTPVSNQAKQHAWECIARKVNSVETVGGEHRTVNDVRRKWVCLLSETKKAEMQRRRRMAAAGTGSTVSSSVSGISSSSGLGGSGEYTPLLAENILNICKSMENGGRESASSVGRPSTRLSVEDANDLSMSSSSATTGGGFVSEVNLIGHSLTNNSSTNNSSNNNNNNGDNGASYLQVTSVYSQNEHIDGVEVHLNDSPLGDVHSPTMSNKGSNIIASIKSLSRQTANIRNNSSGVGNNRVATDVTASSLYPISNINNRDVMPHLSNMNSDIGIVHITPNINSNVYADSTVYLNEAGGSNMNLPGGTVMSLRKRRHSQQGATNDQGRNHTETEGLLSDDAEGDMADDDTAAEMDPNVPSIEQIEWNIGPPYTNTTYINSSGSEPERKATPDHQPYHVTISGAESDIESEVRPRRRKFYKTEEDYTEKLYWVEKKRLKIEERRLAIEEERLAIERERLELEKEKVKANQQNINETLPSSARPGSGRTLSSPVVCKVVESPTDEDNDGEQQSSATVPVSTISTNWTSEADVLRMTTVALDMTDPRDSVVDEDSVGISY